MLLLVLLVLLLLLMRIRVLLLWIERRIRVRLLVETFKLRHLQARIDICTNTERESPTVSAD